VLTEPLIMTTSHQLPRKPIVRTTEGAGNISPGNHNQSEFHDSVSSFTVKSVPSVSKGNTNNDNNNSSNNNSSNNNNNNNLRRVRSDNLAQRNNRRSIFGHYFQDKPRSYSVPHLVRENGLQQLPPPSLSQLHHQHQQKPQSPSSRRSIKRSSSTSASSSSISTTSDLYQPTILEVDENCHGNNGNNNHHRPADYRVFAPSREQLATSAICNRFRELNKGHQHDYESLLQRQIVIEQSLPPFPSPLRRFCSDVTGLSAGVDSAWFNTSSLSNPTNHNGRFSTSNDSSGEMHHYCGGVYSLLTPVSVLRPGKYSNVGKNNDGAAKNIESNDSTTKENLAPQNKSGEEKLNPPLSMTSSFNLPRSSLKVVPPTNLTAATSISATSVVTIVEGEEEKKKHDNSTAVSATNFIGECISEDFCDVVDSEDKMEQEEQKEEEEEQQRLRFDPRVTVTEFEDSIRKWYEEDELNQLKGEAIVLAQSYLKQHPAVAKWYQTAKLDLVTKTYRKRALFSLPVFSSSYSNNTTKTDSLQSAVSVATASSSFQQNEQLPPSSIKKILVVDPHPAIASLFCRSMKSMFPSAELVTSLSAEQASRMIKQSFLTNNGLATTKIDNSTTGFDIIIVEQNLTPQITSSQNNNKNSNNMDTFLNNLDKGPFGLIEILMKKNREESKAAAEKKKLSLPMSCELRYGSELIELISKLIEQQDRNDPSSSCLVIGVSVQPDRDATKMQRAGADFVWGKPIPSVGNSLRNKLLSKLLAKRNPSGDT